MKHCTFGLVRLDVDDPPLVTAAVELRLAEFHRRLYEICETYESHISALADWLVIPLPAWLPEVDARDDWQTGMQEETH